MDVKRVEKALAISEKASGWVILHTNPAPSRQIS
jgi:hypothetical protein